MALFGLNILSLGAAALLNVTPANAPALCEMPASPPAIHVTITESPVQFETDKNRHELTVMRKKTPIYSPYSPHDMHESLVGGMMSGILRLDHKLNFVQHYNPASGDGCIGLDSLSVNINLSPKIYIAREFRSDACWFQEIFTHELKHLEVDRNIARQYNGWIQSGLESAFSHAHSYWSGPMAQKELVYAKNRIKKNVETLLNKTFEAMSQDRAYLQKRVDSEEEYHMISHACPPLPKAQ